MAAGSLLAFAAASPPSGANSPAQYRVHGQTSLGEVSIRLYGTTKFWPRIAKWNRLKAPYRIREGQRLRLEVAPTLDAREGDRRLLAMWRARLDSEAGAMPEKAPPAAASALVTAAPDAENEVAKREFARAQAEEAAAEGTADPSQPPSAERLAQDGAEQLERKDFAKAAETLRRSRELDPGPLGPWMMELNALRNLGREDDARKTAQLLVDAHPEVRPLPAVSALLGPSEPESSE